MTPPGSGEDPDWPRASSWLADGRDPGAGIGVVGVPLATGAISPYRGDATPAAVRAALRRFATFHAPSGVDLRAVPVGDHGDLALDGLDLETAHEAIARWCWDHAGAQRLLVLLGGHNGITRPAFQGLFPEVTAGLLTLDAHHDVRGFHAGPTNGTPVRALIEDGAVPGDLVVQVGIGDFTNSAAHRRWAQEQGVDVVTAAQARAEGVAACVRARLDALAARCEAVYVDLDLDVLDAAFAPGCPGARPGGLAPHELHAAAFAAGAHPAVRAVDLVEVDATRDPGGVTVDTTALCLLHVAAGFGSRAAATAEEAVG